MDIYFKSSHTSQKILKQTTEKRNLELILFYIIRSIKLTIKISLENREKLKTRIPRKARAESKEKNNYKNQQK